MHTNTHTHTHIFTFRGGWCWTHLLKSLSDERASHSHTSAVSLRPSPFMSHRASLFLALFLSFHLCFSLHRLPHFCHPLSLFFLPYRSLQAFSQGLFSPFHHPLKCETTLKLITLMIPLSGSLTPNIYGTPSWVLQSWYCPINMSTQTCISSTKLNVPIHVLPIGAHTSIHHTPLLHVCLQSDIFTHAQMYVCEWYAPFAQPHSLSRVSTVQISIRISAELRPWPQQCAYCISMCLDSLDLTSFWTPYFGGAFFGG